MNLATIMDVLDPLTIRECIEILVHPAPIPHRPRRSPISRSEIRVHLHSQHGSWLNLVEGLFSGLLRSILRHIRVSSKQELKESAHGRRRLL
jgi:hypothetical protein